MLFCLLDRIHSMWTQTCFLCMFPQPILSCLDVNTIMKPQQVVWTMKTQLSGHRVLSAAPGKCTWEGMSLTISLRIHWKIKSQTGGHGRCCSGISFSKSLCWGNINHYPVVQMADAEGLQIGVYPVQFSKTLCQNKKYKLGMVAHTHNPRYLRDWNRKITSLSPA